MNQIQTYYVVLRTKEKDEQFTMIDAMSLDEAIAIFEIRHKVDKESMTEGCFVRSRSHIQFNINDCISYFLVSF